MVLRFLGGDGIGMGVGVGVGVGVGLRSTAIEGDIADSPDTLDAETA